MYPDIELLLVDYLEAKTGRRAVTELPAELDSILPVIRVTRISGGDDPGFSKLDRPVVDVDVFAATRADAHDLSKQIRGLLRGDLVTVDTVQPAGVVTEVKTITAPRWLPDSNVNLRRYNASYEITAHA